MPYTSRNGEPSRSELAYRALKDRVLSGEFEPGARMVEAQLAASLQLSRTPVREALRRLTSEELVTRDATGALVVRVASSREVEEVYLIREVFDGLSARLAAQRISEIELLVAQQTIRRMRQAAETEDMSQVIEANLAFHDALYEATGNERLIRMGRELRDFVQLVSRRPLGSPHRSDEIVAEHEAIVEGLRDRDPAAAERAARLHVAAARASVLQALADDEAHA